MKEYNHIDVAKFAVSQDIEEEPAFAWWVPYTLKKRDIIFSAVNSRYHKCTHIFDIEIPKYTKDTKIIYDTNGNTYRKDIIAKEINAIRIAFKILHDDKKIPPIHQQIRYHLIFGVKMDDFQRKASYVCCTWQHD